MGQAVLALLSVILGATIAGSISLWQVQLVTRREREARHALREQERKDRRDAFQRDAILALQSTVENYCGVITNSLNQSIRATHEHGPGPVPEELKLEYDALYGRLITIRAHIFDDELRGLVEQVLQEGISAAKIGSFDQKATGWAQALKTRHAINDRANTLLRDLF
jgi:hypothetical protein